jgi:hypothetical protein
MYRESETASGSLKANIKKVSEQEAATANGPKILAL